MQLGVCKTVRIGTEVLQRLLLMSRNWIVDKCLNTSIIKMRLKCIPVITGHNEQVMNVILCR